MHQQASRSLGSSHIWPREPRKLVASGVTLAGEPGVSLAAHRSARLYSTSPFTPSSC